MAIPNWKVPLAIETSGAVVVGEESCVGIRNTRDLVDGSATDLKELLDALVDRTLKIECACFSPNPERLDTVRSMVRELKADGVVHYNLLNCTPYAMESFQAKKVLEEDGIPTLRLETDYSQDFGQVKNRVEAFVEMVQDRN